jgi:FtsP/CotA-like multicopper oxidase with cupredoxin domain
MVNGTAYPKVTVDPKAYRVRLLNASNDRFFNFSLYQADMTPGTLGQGYTEVALNAAEVPQRKTTRRSSRRRTRCEQQRGRARLDQFANEGGWLPTPTVIDGQQPTTWITDPARFDVGNVDKHSLLLAPAERADTIVDFSKFAGKTLILYNDAPAAFPARVPTYDYYTGAPTSAPPALRPPCPATDPTPAPSCR